MIHPIQGFKALPTKKKAAIIGAAVAVTALNVAAAAHGKKVLGANFVAKTTINEAGEKVKKTGMFKKLGKGYGDWASKIAGFVGKLFHKNAAEEIVNKDGGAGQVIADAAAAAGQKLEDAGAGVQ
ncbi:hypothetical protein IJ531_07100 [bacterium]|nr:hypothetical protein [bacterium]